jgi:hypothetical protein
MIEAYVDDPPDPATAAWRQRFGTLALVAVGLLVFEVSANPSLGVAIACLKFAWDDARDGVWLRRVDPDRRRGWACCWIYLGVGLLKASLIAFVGGVAMAVFAYHFGARLGWPPRLMAAQLLGAFGVMVFGVISSAFASLIAVVIAARSRAKLWVGPEARQARERGEWPPRIAAGGVSRKNRASNALIIMITGVVLVACILLYVFVGIIIPVVRPALRQFEYMVFLVFGVGIPLGAAISDQAIQNEFRFRVVAKRPADCWPETIHRFPIASVDDLE